MYGTEFLAWKSLASIIIITLFWKSLFLKRVSAVDANCTTIFPTRIDQFCALVDIDQAYTYTEALQECTNVQGQLPEGHNVLKAMLSIYEENYESLGQYKGFWLGLVDTHYTGDRKAENLTERKIGWQWLSSGETGDYLTTWWSPDQPSDDRKGTYMTWDGTKEAIRQQHHDGTGGYRLGYMCFPKGECDSMPVDSYFISAENIMT